MSEFDEKYIIFAIAKAHGMHDALADTAYAKAESLHNRRVQWSWKDNSFIQCLASNPELQGIRQCR